MDIKCITKIKMDIAQKKLLERDLFEFKTLYSSQYLLPEQKKVLAQEITRLKFEIGLKDNFMYSSIDIKEAKPTEMLIENFLPRGGIIPIIGHYGSGKTTLSRYLYRYLLETRDDVYVKYIDADNPLDKLQSFGVHMLIEKYGERFEYYGKRSEFQNMADSLDEVLLVAIEQQRVNPNRIYLVIEDNLKNLARKNRKGFIDVNYLYQYEKPFQAVGGTTIILHHTNKQGIFADTKDIVNFADLAYYVKFNESTNAILVEPDKQSRYHVTTKAFYVNPARREITHEIDFRTANLSFEETKIMQYVKDLLDECGEFNQSELEKETRAFRGNIGMGEKRFRAILKKYDAQMWKIIRGDNNALIFAPLDTLQVQNLPNHVNEGRNTAKPVANADQMEAK